jgi:3-hydroxyisobutyrate dehydrogenase
LPTPSAFGHGAKLLAKDVRLLGEVLGADPAYAPFRDVVAPFLQLLQRQ